MKSGAFVVAGLLALGLGPAAAFSQTQTETIVTPVIVTGDVIRFEPGKLLVVRSEGKELVYTLTPAITVPADVQVGRKVSVHTERGSDGNTSVTRVVTTSITPEGQVKRTVEETRTQPTGETSKVTTVTVQGTVQAYEPGKSITVLRSDGKRVLYMFGDKAILPADVAIGKTITIQSLPVTETVIIEKQP